MPGTVLIFVIVIENVDVGQARLSFEFGGGAPSSLSERLACGRSNLVKCSLGHAAGAAGAAGARSTSRLSRQLVPRRSAPSEHLPLGCLVHLGSGPEVDCKGQ